MPTKMISRGGHRYGTRMMTAGQEFEAQGQSEVRLLRALKWADLKPPELPPTPGADKTAPTSTGSESTFRSTLGADAGQEARAGADTSVGAVRARTTRAPRAAAQRAASSAPPPAPPADDGDKTSE